MTEPAHINLTALTRIPDSGQFIAIWEYNGKLWCETCRRCRDGSIERYCETEDDWVDTTQPHSKVERTTLYIAHFPERENTPEEEKA